MRTLLSAALLVVLASPGARAGDQNVDCRHPRVFPGVMVNAVVLPYEYVGARERAVRSRAAERLSLLLQRELLLSLLRYPSFGVVQLVKVEPDAPCELDTVVDQLLGKRPGAEVRLAPGHGAVFLWGFLYEQGEELYLRSFVRFFRNVPDRDPVRLKLGQFALTGPMPVESVALPPARLLASDLNEIERLFRGAGRVYERPDPNSRSQEIPYDSRYPFAYLVTDARGDWMRLEPMRVEGSLPAPSGWVRVETHTGPSLVRAKIPEIQFVVSAVGYLQGLMFEGSDPAALKRSVGLGRAALAEYVKAAGLARAPETDAAVRVLAARLTLLEDRSAESWKKALAEVDRAAELSAASPELRNFQAICRAWLAYNAAAPYSSDRIAQDLRDAAARSADRRVLSNLSNLYQAMLSGPQLRPQNVEETRAELRKVEAIERASK